MYNPQQYTYSVTYSTEDQVFIANVAEFSLDAAHGDTPEEALKQAQIVVQEAIELLKEHGDPIPMPDSLFSYSGKLLLRMPLSLHRALVTEARQEGVSLNQLITLKLGVSLAQLLQTR